MAYVYTVPSEHGIKLDGSAAEQKGIFDWKQSCLQLNLKDEG